MTSILDLLTPEQKQQLVAELLSGKQATAVAEPPAPPAPTRSAPARSAAPAPRRGAKSATLDLSDAKAVHFTASLNPNERCRDQTWAQTFDTITVKGHYQVKGPKGGMYCLGQAVLSSPEGDTHQLTLKIANKNFLLLQAGGEIDGWCVDPTTKESLFIGTLGDYTPVP